MFNPLTLEERRDFLSQNVNSYIPGYTGHCPTLKFHYGKPYGSRTKEILKELRSQKIYDEIHRVKYRANDFSSPLLKPLDDSKGQYHDDMIDYPRRFPNYITGYTGFIPSMNYRYGKSYGRIAQESFSDFKNEQRRVQRAHDELNNVAFSGSKATPKLTPIRSNDEVKEVMEQYVENIKFKGKEISPDCPPIAGYTGHIPGVKGNEESLSKRYFTIVKNGLTILREERKKREEMHQAKKKVVQTLEDVDKKYNYILDYEKNK